MSTRFELVWRYHYSVLLACFLTTSPSLRSNPSKKNHLPLQYGIRLLPICRWAWGFPPRLVWISYTYAN